MHPCGSLVSSQLLFFLVAPLPLGYLLAFHDPMQTKLSHLNSLACATWRQLLYFDSLLLLL
jgi:hypothetical protein